ncbi:COX15/CtaA family protein [Angustibacter sp. McL0619]|uniref:COX15/CtaA family protein n=1 Tax=Angustibacter sp. McL0619 TaxID=3415676 RepID=UPI003CF64554
MSAATTPAAATATEHRADPLTRWVHVVLVINVVVQIGIVVTGGLVRLTGSGLGCPSWPECVPGSYTPVVHQPQGVHKYIEFGNRTLTSVVGVVALAAFIGVLLEVRRRGRPRSLVAIASLPLVGVVVQAVLGGITVLTHLNPATVAAHFLVSMGLVCVSTYLLWRVGEPDGPAEPVVRSELVWLARALAAVTVLVLVLGTVVTGSGPHSGDADAPARFGLDPRSVSWLHSDAVLVWFGVLGMLIIALRLTAAGARPRREAWVTLTVGAAQGVIGYVQYLTGLPVVAVGLHMLGASLLVVAVTRLLLSLRERSVIRT